MREEVLEVLYAAISTVGRAEVGDLPVGEILGEFCFFPDLEAITNSNDKILEYIVSTFGSDHYVCANGVADTVSRLSSQIPASNIHLNTTISHLSQIPSNGSSRTRIHFEDPSSPTLDFDYVIFATQANQASRILKASQDPKAISLENQLQAQRIEALDKFEYGEF